ncbi:MAG: DUF421 domain-containing protein [Pseudomonadota bacterium]
MDWSNLFGFEVSPVELVLRGTLIYWFLFLCFRFVLRRDAGAVGIADILLVVLIADASQSGLTGDAHSVAESGVVVATLIGWNYLLDWAGFHFEPMRKLLEPPPLLLIDRGRVQRRNLRREFVTPEDLLEQLRKHGVDDMSLVRACYMEGDGEFSVLLYDRPPTPEPPGRRPSA